MSFRTNIKNQSKKKTQAKRGTICMTDTKKLDSILKGRDFTTRA